VNLCETAMNHFFLLKLILGILQKYFHPVSGMNVGMLMPAKGW